MRGIYRQRKTGNIVCAEKFDGSFEDFANKAEKYCGFIFWSDECNKIVCDSIHGSHVIDPNDYIIDELKGYIIRTEHDFNIEYERINNPE